jgi:hypothetical protein
MTVKRGKIERESEVRMGVFCPFIKRDCIQDECVFYAKAGIEKNGKTKQMKACSLVMLGALAFLSMDLDPEDVEVKDGIIKIGEKRMILEEAYEDGEERT